MDLDAALNWLGLNPGEPLDLAELALLLARDEYPSLDIEAHLNELSGMAHEVRRYLRGSLAAQVHGLCRYLFHEMGFHGNQSEYYDPRNSYFNQVLERRTGLPITLSLLAMAVGNRAGLEVAGIGLPGHFVVKAMDGLEEVIFDPFHGGRQLTLGQCETLVEQITGEPYRATAESLRPELPGRMLFRVLTNLKLVYFRSHDYRRALRVIGRLRQLAPHDLTQRRDLAVSLLETGEPGKALDHLTVYLSQAVKPADQAKVEELLQRARTEVARWN